MGCRTLALATLNLRDSLIELLYCYESPVAATRDWCQRGEKSVAQNEPWHVPGKWRAATAFWEPEVQAQFKNKPAQVRMLDCTLAEGPDAVGCHLSWRSRVELASLLDEIGVGGITTPGGCSCREELDWIRTVKRNGVKALIFTKFLKVPYPSPSEGWKELMDRGFELGGDVNMIYSRWIWDDMVSDFSLGTTKAQVIEAIQEGVAYAKSQGVTVNYSHGDTFRHRVSTVLSFYKAALEAGADSFYLWDSRGNSNPFAAFHLVSKVKEMVGERPICIQFHNDLGLASANSFAAAMAGATMLDCSVLGIGDRGGCVSLEELACALEIYGMPTGIKLEKLYELAQYTEKAFNTQVQVWKPIVGRYSFTENGWGHREAGDPEETSSGLAPSVVGRGTFGSMLGGRVFSERDKRFWTDMLDIWGYSYTD